MQSEVIALVSVWLFAAHHGCWCYLATVSAVWDCVSGWHLCQRLHVMTRLVEDYDGWLRLLANVMWSIMKDGMRDFFGYYLNNKGYVRKSSNKLQVGLWRRSGCSFGTLGYGALLPFTLMATTNMDLWHVLWRTWRSSHTQGFFKTTGARWGPTLGVVIARGLDLVVSFGRVEYGVFAAALHVKDPAVALLVQCGLLFLRVPGDVGPIGRSSLLHESRNVGGRQS